MNKRTAYIVLLLVCCLGAYIAGRYRSPVFPVPSFPERGVSDGQTATVVSSFAGIRMPEYVPVRVNLAGIFASDHSWVATMSGDRIRTVIATGDVIPARSVNKKVVDMASFRWPYEKTYQVLRNADLTVINLETPLLHSCTPTDSGMSFCGDARNLEGLTYADIDIAGLANNHAGNYGISGVTETVELLTQSGISVTGVDTQPVIKNIRGIEFVFLSYNDIGSPEQGIAWAELGNIREDIRNVRRNNSIVIVSFHWGAEYQRLPDARQVSLAHAAVDAGADLVLGNHPHWIQPPEIYHGTLIMYAHGNFVFDQEWSEETKLGVIGKYTFFDTELIDAEFFPVRIVEYGQPYFLQSSAKQSVLDHVRDAATDLSRK